MAPLPPPPDNPVRPPPYRFSSEVKRLLTTHDGVKLEALATINPLSPRSAVLCHPHPLFGGTMHNALLIALAKHWQDAALGQLSVLRFNFRGVEGSGGTHCGADGEVLDVIASVESIRRELPHTSISLVGYSFGSWAAFHAVQRIGIVDRLALIAPPVRLLPYVLENDRTNDPARRPTQIVVGSHDEFVTVSEARQLAEALGATLHVIQGADHFFTRQRKRVAETLLPFALPEIG